MYLVGLTGGIGSGKSTVAQRLRLLEWEVIDADAVAREIVEPGEPTLDDLVERFGSTILRADGSLNRQELARVAFRDERARADLDRITHPRIAARIAERIAQYGAAERARILVDHPLLVETGQAGRFDAVVVVLAAEQQRIRRLVEERGLEESDVRARMRAQVDDEQRLAAATHVVRNDGTMEELLARVDELHAELLAGADA